MNKILKNISFVAFLDRNLIKFILPLAIVSILLIIYTVLSYQNSAPPSTLLGLLLLDMILILSLIVIFTRKILVEIFHGYQASRIRARIILLFSIITAIPTIVISSFSVLIFNFGIQSWFDDKVSTSINQSMRVADLYLAENRYHLKEDAVAIANDLNDLYFDLIQNPVLMNKVLATQTELRALTEAIIFQRNSSLVLAQTSMAFSLSFWAIPQLAYDKAESGDVPDVSFEKGKLRMLVKLREFDDTYLIVGRLVDEEIVNYINQTSGAAAQYKEMKTKQGSFIIQFALLFIFLSLILILSTIAIGAIFANKISSPIRKLVKATELVQSGDLSTYVDIEIGKEDELVILTNAFNKMVKKLDIQQKDLVLAQRAQAWSDVARRVAHEIKNPLTPIGLSADRIYRKFMNDVEDKEALKKYVDTITRHTRDIQKIVANFVEFAKMPGPNFEYADIVKLLKDLVESRQIIHDKLRYRFFSNVDSLNFMCDITQINQVIVNLLKNSEESLENIDYEQHIDISVSLSAEDLEITVSDNGRGFPQELIDKVAEPYMTTRSKGSGLGLAIVKKIVQDHGGEITFANSAPQGAVVKLIFDAKHLESKSKK